MTRVRRDFLAAAATTGSLHRMAWTWKYFGADGEPVEGTDPGRFSTQADAETWLGHTWRALAEDGVASVSLYEDGRMVYGPMSLSP